MKLTAFLISLIPLTSAASAEEYTFKCDTGTVHPQIVTVDTTKQMVQIQAWGNNTGLACTTTLVNGRHAPMITGRNADYCASIMNMWNGGANTSAHQIVGIRGNEVAAFTWTDDGGTGEFHLNFRTGMTQDGHGHVGHCKPQHDIRE
jgi:hypothetical protein